MHSARKSMSTVHFMNFKQPWYSWNLRDFQKQVEYNVGRERACFNNICFCVSPWLCLEEHSGLQPLYKHILIMYATWGYYLRNQDSFFSVACTRGEGNLVSTIDSQPKKQLLMILLPENAISLYSSRLLFSVRTVGFQLCWLTVVILCGKVSVSRHRFLKYHSLPLCWCWH